MRSRRTRQAYRRNWQIQRLRQTLGSPDSREKLSPRLKSWRNQSKRGRRESEREGERGRKEEGGGGGRKGERREREMEMGVIQ